jgi:hypothetical protein
MSGFILALALQATPPLDQSATPQTILCGVVSDVAWAKPAVIIDLEVFTATNGAAVGRWKLTGGSPNTMMRAGLTRDNLRARTLVVVRADWDGRPCVETCIGRARDWRFPNAPFLGTGSSGTQPPPSPPSPSPASCENLPKSRSFQ